MGEWPTFKPVWNVQDVKQFFADHKPPPYPIELDSVTHITHNAEGFIERHIGYVERNNGNPAYRRYFTRLKKLKKIILDYESGARCI